MTTDTTKGNDVNIAAVVARAERAEAELYHRLISSAPAESTARLGVATGRIGGGVLTSVRNDVTGYWSTALGLGIDEPVTTLVIDRIIEFFTAEGNLGATILVPPALIPADWATICDRHSLQSSYGRFQHICPIEDADTTASSDLHVGRVTDAAQLTRFTMRGFGMPDGDIADMLIPGYGSDDVQMFGAWDGDNLVAGASSFIWEDVAVLHSATTLPSHRNRGAQCALIGVRVAAAAEAGCRWIVAQTGVPDLGTANPSTNNMIRAGLAPLYARPVWTWGTPNATVD
jgi:hypothetical protein